MSTVGERIKQGRNTKGMTQKQLAKKLGVSENYINDVENGRKVVEEKFIERVGKVLGGDLAEMTTLFDNIAYEERKSSESNLKTHNLAKGNKVKETMFNQMESVTITNDADVNFLQQMIYHHEGAIYSRM